MAAEVKIEPTEGLRRAVDNVLAELRTPYEREEALVYWGENNDALVIVPGEKGVRKQQAIIVSERDTMSAVVKGWRFGLTDTSK